MWVTSFLLGIFTELYKCFIRPALKLKNLGDWAIVTGCTDGIGKAIAIELAKSQKLNIILVGRGADRLKAVSNEVEKFGVKAECCVLDCQSALETVEQVIRDVSADKDIAVLVNNVGVGYDHAKYYHELDKNLRDSLLSVNIEATRGAIQAVLQGMITKKTGAIVNIGSGYGEVPTPFYTEYSATKSYVSCLGAALDAELKTISPKLSAQCISPLMVVSKLSKVRKSSLFCPMPEEFAKYAVKRIGFESNSSPYPTHALLLGVMRFMPRILYEFLSSYRGSKIRNIAMKKKNISVK